MSNEALLIAQEVLAERDRQDTKWGEQNHPDGTGPDTRPLRFALGINNIPGNWPAVHLAEAATMETDHTADVHPPRVTWRHILLEEVFEALAEDDLDKLRTELIQVAAVSQQWVQAIDRRRMNEIHESRSTRR